MIHYTIDNETLPEADQNIQVKPERVSTLTLERNSTLIARFSRDSGYSIDELQELRRMLRDTFPNHQVIVWYDDVDFLVIHDKGYPSERLYGVNEDKSYY